MGVGARVLVVCLTAVVSASPASAATVSGAVSEVFVGVLPGTQVVVRGVATGQDEHYREHFQFAPSRGRSLTIGLSAGAF